MDQSLISVIIPIYNMEQYLERCLDSVLNNTYRNLEIICVDDGSTDSSLEILRRYEVKDPRIVVITKENGGVSSARNAGLDRMTGEYVTFVDPDDYVHPQYVELLYKSLRDSETRVSICGYMTVETDIASGMLEAVSFNNSPVSVKSQIQVFKNRNLRSYCWGKLFSTDLVKEVRFTEALQLAEDTVFCAEVFEAGNIKQASVFMVPLYYYYQREGSAVKVSSSHQLFQFGNVWMQRLRLTGRDDIYLDKALEWFLSIRYMSTHIKPDRDSARRSNQRLLELRSYLRKTRIYSTVYRLVYFAFIYFPGVYWLHRVTGDPSMWKWEKVERKKRREQRAAARARVSQANRAE